MINNRENKMRLFNSLSRSFETLEPIQKGRVGVYSCGPTVYSTATIGNFRSFLAWDVLVRTLERNGLEVKFVMNITDVGHLVSDADTGEDKLEVGAKREGKSAWEIAKLYTAEFLSDMKRLNMREPDIMPKATEHIAEQVAMIQVLEKKGFAYRISDGIYFDTSKIKNYGELAGQALSEKEEGARIGVNDEKKNPADFALWKFSPEGTKRQMEWDSPWGMGFPGWHIECTAMSTKYLGELYDIHTGGADLKMTHHPNEIAQSEGANGTTEANVWLHSEFLQVDGGKMSKSLGNAYTIQELIDKGYDPLAFRYLCLTAHYRSHLNFTFESLDAAASALNRLRRFCSSLERGNDRAEEYENRFLRTISDDLNTPEALAILWELIHDERLSQAAKASSISYFDRVFGLGLLTTTSFEIPDSVKKLVAERDEAREKRDFATSDSLRDKINSFGYTVEDTPNGTKISKA